MVNPPRKRLVKSIAARPVGRPSLVQEILKLMYEPILVRNRMNATAVIRSFQTNRSLIVTWKRTTNKLPNALSPVILVEKPFTTAPLSTLMYAPLINNPSLPLTGNALLKKLQILRPRKDRGDRTKQVRVPLQNQLPQQVLKTPLLPGNLIWFSFQSNLFQLAKKMLPKHTGNIGRRSVRVLAARIVYKAGTISASQPSTQPASENNWTVFLRISLQFSKSTFPLVLSSVIQRLGPSNITIHPRTTTSC